jgi:hypothetical protein
MILKAFEDQQDTILVSFLRSNLRPHFSCWIRRTLRWGTRETQRTPVRLRSRTRLRTAIRSGGFYLVGTLRLTALGAAIFTKAGRTLL